MSDSSFLRQFRPRGVFWRHFLAWAVNNVPWHLETMMMLVWTGFFYLFWAPGRRAVVHNLSAIHPGSTRFRNLLRAYRVFLEFAWNFEDTARFNEQQASVDWEFEGSEHLEALMAHEGGAIILTAHMGNYDLGSYLFAENIGRPITVVRVPEVDPESEKYSSSRRETVSDGFRVDYNTDASSVALSMISTLRDGQVVAIQGDRVLSGVGAKIVQLFGRDVEIPLGPFVLAMSAGVPIFPLFVTRAGKRSYRITVFPPITVERTGRDRDRDLEGPINLWRGILESIIKRWWHQWFAFERFDERRTS